MDFPRLGNFALSTYLAPFPCYTLLYLGQRLLPRHQSSPLHNEYSTDKQYPRFVLNPIFLRYTGSAVIVISVGKAEHQSADRWFIAPLGRGTPGGRFVANELLCYS